MGGIRNFKIAIRAGMVRSAKDWQWSSYGATAGFKEAPAFLVTDWILAGFADRKPAAHAAYCRFVSEGRGQASLWEELKNQIYLGSDHFVEHMQRQMNPEQSLDDIPKVQMQGPRNTLKQVGAHFGVSYATVSRAAGKHDAYVIYEV